MLGDWLETLVEFLSSTWREILTASLDLLTGNLANVLSGVGFSAAKNINGLFISTGAVILVICFFVGVTANTSKFTDLQSPVVLGKLLVRFIATLGVISGSWSFMLLFLDWVRRLLDAVVGFVGLGTIYRLTTPDGTDGIFATTDVVKEKFKNLSTAEAALGNIIFVLYIVAMLTIIIMFLYVVFGRVVKIYLYQMVAPLPLGTFAAAETSQTAKAFVRSYIALLAEAIVILLAIYLTAILAAGVRGLFPGVLLVNSGDSNLVGVVKYCFGSLIMAGLLISMVKAGERLAEKMIG